MAPSASRMGRVPASANGFGWGAGLVRGPWTLGQPLAGCPKPDGGGRDAAERLLGRFRTLAWVTAGATFALLLVGAGVVATGAGLSCPGWPLCGGRVVPVFSGVVVVEWSHRVGALAVTLLSLATAAAAGPLRGRGPWAALSLAAVALLVVQVALGAVVVESKLPAAAIIAHQGLGVALLCLWAAAATARRAGPDRLAAGGAD